ncbi:MAG: DUF2092 domain-containing protein [Leptolyngbyaceae cyanobacterium bins.349]|nr:DUF2092 domain-containing protein [Leptolyngbyaceae cyanobacterium bins.349]
MGKIFDRVLCVLIGSSWALTGLPGQSNELPKGNKTPAIEPQAAQILKQMSDYLKGLPQFSVQAEITEDILFDSGQKIQFGRNVTAIVRRPNQFKIYSEGDLSSGQLFYDGKTMTLMDLTQNAYSTVLAPAEIDNALLHAIKTYNLRAPLADLIYTNVYEYLTSGTTVGYYIGLSKVQGQMCHHLAFRKKDIDWQIWIENDSTPVPCKLVITDKQEVQGLQFTALLNNWNTAPKLDDQTFSFVPPAQAKKVDLLTLPPVSAPMEPKKTGN